MPQRSRLVLSSLALLAAGLAAAGCEPQPPSNTNPPPHFTFPPPGGSGGAPGGNGGAPGGGPSSPIGSVMKNAFGRSQYPLWPLIKQDLTANPPNWDDLQPRAKELADQTATLSGMEPPKGKDTWEQDAKNFAAIAADLNAAAQAKDAEKVQAAQSRIDMSCKDCHTAHRNMGR